MAHGDSASSASAGLSRVELLGSLLGCANADADFMGFVGGRSVVAEPGVAFDDRDLVGLPPASYCAGASDSDVHGRCGRFVCLCLRLLLVWLATCTGWCNRVGKGIVGAFGGWITGCDLACVEYRARPPRIAVEGADLRASCAGAACPCDASGAAGCRPIGAWRLAKAAEYAGSLPGTPAPKLKDYRLLGAGTTMRFQDAQLVCLERRCMTWGGYKFSQDVYVSAVLVGLAGNYYSRMEHVRQEDIFAFMTRQYGANVPVGTVCNIF